MRYRHGGRPWQAFPGRALLPRGEARLRGGDRRRHPPAPGARWRRGGTSRAATRSTPRRPVHLPYPSLGDLFRGREADLDALHDHLRHTGDRRATAIVATASTLHGLGGVGKTRLAVEYAWRHLDDHAAVLFVPAGTPASLRRNLAALAGPLVLDLPEHRATEEEAQVLAVVRWLRVHPGWLLVLDNVDTPEAATAVEELVARLAGGRVLVTSRLSTWGPHVEARELDVLAEDDAIAFLLARTASRRRKTEDDETDAREALAELETYSLVTRVSAEPELTVHRLVQDVTRRRQHGDPAPEGLVQALGWVDDAFVGKPQDVRTWPTLDPLAAHVQALVRHADEAAIAEPTARLMNQLGLLLLTKARLAEAEPLMRRHVEIFLGFTRRTGHEHPHLRPAFRNYRGLLEAMGRSEEEIEATLRPLAPPEDTGES